MALNRFTLQTPLGAVVVLQSEQGICRIVLGLDGVDESLRVWRKRFAPHEVCVEGEPDRILREALAAYFGGEREPLAVRLDLRGSDFQMKVWRELQRIPLGSVRTYKQVAEAVASPGASQAVGSANGANPLPILVPCHRVVSSKGLGGFSAPMEWKLGLLRLEGVCLDLG